MTINNVMFYKVFHTDKHAEIRYFDTCQAMKAAADQMIESFKFWGGGQVPVAIESYKVRKSGKHAGTVARVDYNPSLYMDYARENGTKYGYYKEGGAVNG